MCVHVSAFPQLHICTCIYYLRHMKFLVIKKQSIFKYAHLHYIVYLQYMCIHVTCMALLCNKLYTSVCHLSKVSEIVISVLQMLACKMEKHYIHTHVQCTCTCNLRICFIIYNVCLCEVQRLA